MKQEIAKEIFNMVYQWGKAGVITNYTSETYQRLLVRLMIEDELENFKKFYNSYPQSYFGFANEEDFVNSLYSFLHH